MPVTTAPMVPPRRARTVEAARPRKVLSNLLKQAEFWYTPLDFSPLTTPERSHMPSRPTGQWGLLQMYSAAGFGSRWQTALWLKPDSSLPGSFDIQAAALALFTTYAGALIRVMNDTATILGARLTVNNGTYSASADVDSPLGGDLSSGSIPPDDFIVVRMQAGVAGRNGKGRFFISGLDQSIQDDGRVNVLGATKMAGIIAVLNVAQTGGGVSWNVQQYDHKDNLLHLPDFFSYNPVLGNKKKRSPIF